MSEPRVVATGLQFPEGPIAEADGSVLLVEIARGTLSRVTPDGEVAVVADCGGGPNGAAYGPDGKVYVCNNGGCFRFKEVMGLMIPGEVPTNWSGGSIQRVDPVTGDVETVYTESSSGPLRAPNDWSSTSSGGFGSLITGFASSAPATERVCTTPRSTVLLVLSEFIHSMLPTASGCHLMVPGSMPRRPTRAGFGFGM